MEVVPFSCYGRFGYRFCAATVIKNKLITMAIKGFFIPWITTFGAPSKLLTDNGCEFNNVEMRGTGEAFDIKVMTTAAKSPWSNGVCERLNAVIGSMVSKITADIKCDVKEALA